MMICAKCKKPIERSYGRVTDTGNYCRECAIQNELKSRKNIAEQVAQIAQSIRKETAKEILQEVGKVCGDYQWFKNLCKQYGVEV